MNTFQNLEFLMPIYSLLKQNVNWEYQEFQMDQKEGCYDLSVLSK